MGTDEPSKEMLGHLKKVRAAQQGISHSYIVHSKGVKLALEDREGLVAQIYFATDESTLDAQDKAELLKVYNYYVRLLEGPSLRTYKVRFRFVGFADFRGTEKHNVGLSEKRARAVSEYFSPLRSSPNYSQGIVGMGASEHPQNISPGGGPASKQLNPYRRVDVMARPVLSEVTDPPLVDPPPDPGSRSWAFRIIDSAAGSIVVGGAIARLEIIDLTHQLGMVFTFKAFALALGAKLSAGRSSGWCYVMTPRSLTFDDFEGSADHINGALMFGYGYSVDGFVLWGPMENRLFKQITLKFRGWGQGVAGGASLERGSFRKRIGPYPVDAKYLASPPPGTEIR